MAAITIFSSSAQINRSGYRFLYTNTVVLGLFASSLLAFPLLDEGNRPGDAFSNGATPKKWLVRAAANWMKQLPDETPLNKLSIPGTHDTGSLHGGRFCQTQSWTIKEQLKAGIRFFDIRNRRAGNAFAIHHGFCFQKIYFDDVMNQVRDFLKESDGETIIMRVKEEYIPAKRSKSFKQIWNRYMKIYRALFIPDLGKRIPSLGEVRGKVVVLRNAEFSGFGLKYDGPATDIQDYFKVYPGKKDFPFGDDTVSLKQKKEFIRGYICKAKTSTKIVLNYASGSTGLFPDSVAKKTNAAAYKIIGSSREKKTTGVLIMDFPGDRLIYRVLKTNFNPF